MITDGSNQRASHQLGCLLARDLEQAIAQRIRKASDVLDLNDFFEGVHASQLRALDHYRVRRTCGRDRNPNARDRQLAELGQLGGGDWKMERVEDLNQSRLGDCQQM